MAININLKIQKKDVWLLVAIMVFLVGVGYVIAYGSENPQVHGHDAGEIEGNIVFTNCIWTAYVTNVLAGGGAYGNILYCPSDKVVVASQWYVTDHMWANQRFKCCNLEVG